MNERKSDTDAFLHFMKIVTRKPFSREAQADPHDVRISELEQHVRALQRSTRRTLARRRAASAGKEKPPG